MILDGWGKGNNDKADVIFNGNTPYIDNLLKTEPNSQLLTDGENVGLPEGQMGNSEVGHLNIGAGRVIYQDLVKINKAIEDNSIAENPVLKNAFEYAVENKKSVHFIGLVSNGGVHSSEKHLYKLCELADEAGLENAYVHAITDGRDTDPKSGLGFIKDLEKQLENSSVKIATLIGRYFSMDRDKRWDRVKKGYDVMVNGKGMKVRSASDAVEQSYADGKTDEFIEPVVLVNEHDLPVGKIKDGDVVICFNFRTDRLREITTVLSQEDMPDEGMKTLDLNYLTMTRYDENFKGVEVIYAKENVENTMGEILEKTGKKQLRIAETEKFAHVTFFFSGGRGTEFEGETRILVNSPKVATYDLQPEMSIYEVTEKLVDAIKTEENDFICLNYANGDMIGHTGVYEAILKAVSAVDDCVSKTVEAAKAAGYAVMIIADHGNADNAVNPDGSPNTAHSLNPVPCIVINSGFPAVKDGKLADVAPTLLKIMDIDIPKDMTGEILVN